MKLSVTKNNSVVEELDLGSLVSTESASFHLGRASTCTLVLDDKMVSREHAAIDFKGGKWYIRQISEFGAIIINGSAMSEKELATGDIISIGPYLITCFVLPLQAPVMQATETIVPEEEAVSDEATHTVMVDDEAEDVDDDATQEHTQEEGESLESLEDDFSLGDNNEEESEFPEDNDGTEAFGEEYSDGEYSEGEYGEEYSEDYGDGDYGVQEYEDEDKTQVFQSFASIRLEIFGEYAPYDNYNIESSEIRIGRNPEKCQIVLTDPEVSGEHAVIKKNNITCMLEDLQSGNGTLLNGERVNKATLTNGDEFIIGSTTFTVRIGSDFIDKEQNTLMPVEENQIVEVEEVVEVPADFEGDVDDIEGGAFGEDAPKGNQSFLKDPDKRKKAIYGLVFVVVAWVLLGEDPAPTKKPKKDGKKKEQVVQKAKKSKRVFTPEEKEFLDATYQLGKELYSQGKYDQAVFELDKVFAITPEYKQAKQIYDLSKVGLAKLEEIERKKQEEIARKERMRKVKELVEKARVATKDKNVDLAEALFQQIMGLDPENFEVPTLRMEIDSWKKEQERKAVEKAQKEAERKRQVDDLAPGKNFYLKEEWHKAVLKLESYMRKKGIDSDLLEDAGRMLKESKENLNNIVGPLIGKARSLKEGQDLKGAYELYKEVLENDPTSEEALNEMDKIRDTLTNRARKIYNEALVREELSKFEQAKEKFQEVQQIAPSDSEYYRKATDKLKDFIY